MQMLTIVVHKDWKPDMPKDMHFNLHVLDVRYRDYDDSEPDCKRYAIDYKLPGDAKWRGGPGAALSVDRCLRDLSSQLWRGDVDENTAIHFSYEDEDFKPE